MLLIRKENEISKQFDRGEMINKNSVMDSWYWTRG